MELSLFARACVACVALMSTGTANAGWVQTATKTLPLADATLLGPAPPDMPMRITVALKHRNESGLDSYIAAITSPGSPAFGSKLTSAQFAGSYLPTPEQVQSVSTYLRDAGFANISVADNRMLVSANGTAGIVDAAFHTLINRYRFGGRIVFANATGAQIPESLAGTVSSVLRLQNAAGVAPAAAKAAPAPMERLLIPPFLQVAYHAMSTPPASKTVGAIIMLHDVTPVLADLRIEQAMNNQPQFPVEVKVVGGSVATSSSSDSEFALDSQSSSSIAGTFQKMIWYVQGGTLQDMVGFPLPADAINQWVSDDLAPAASMSLSVCEAVPEADGTKAAIDAALKQAVAQGQTLFVASGDSGAFCGAAVTNGENVGVPSVAYPASSPYAVSVGGTTLFTNADSSFGNELAWTGSGGGYSLLDPAPSWQGGVPESPTGGRSVPDISMESVPGIHTILDGAISGGSGTSLSAPLAMGAWARIESANDNQLGFAAPLFYGLEAAGVAAADLSATKTGFRDITIDDTWAPSPLVLYPATTGYDKLTGIGSIDICALANTLSGAGHPDFCAAPVDGLIGVGSIAGTSTTTVAVCALPGMTLADAKPTGAGHSISSLAVAEPADRSGKIAFTIGIDPQSPLLANSFWRVQFVAADGQFHFVQMDTNNGAAAPEFVYGVITDNGGTEQIQGSLDPASTYSLTADTILLVVDKSLIAASTPGTNLAYLFASAIEGNSVTGGIQSDADRGQTTITSYTLRRNDLCGSSDARVANDSAASPRSGALGIESLIILGSLGALRRRRTRRHRGS